MTIAVNPGIAFDIETYDGLIAFVAAKLELDAETVAQLPSLLRMAEARIDRLLIYAERETSESLSTVAGTQTLSLPESYRHIKGIRYVADDGYPLEQVTYNVLHSKFTDNSGKPQAYSIFGGLVHFGPVPDAAYTLSITYIQSLPHITSANQSNWLLQENPDVYINALCYETLKWLEDLDAAELYRAELLSVIEESNLQARRYRTNGPIRLQSPVVV